MNGVSCLNGRLGLYADLNIGWSRRLVRGVKLIVTTAQHVSHALFNGTIFIAPALQFENVKHQ
jgi:hypothetical protein